MVTILSPTPKSSGTGSVALMATATDNEQVQRITISAAGQLRCAGASTASCSWDLSNVAAGTYTISARAEDAAGNQGNSTVSFTVEAPVPDEPPVPEEPPVPDEPFVTPEPEKPVEPPVPDEPIVTPKPETPVEPPAPDDPIDDEIIDESKNDDRVIENRKLERQRKRELRQQRRAERRRAKSLRTGKRIKIERLSNLGRWHR